MQLIERNDPGFGSAVLYRCAYVWRGLFDRAAGRAFASNCSVLSDDNGYTGTVVAQFESDLIAFARKEFRRFKMTTPTQSQDGTFAVHVEPRVLSWPARTV